MSSKKEINIKKKYLLLLNRIHREQLKKRLVKTPTKLTDEEVNTQFNRLFKAKEDYFVPKKLKTKLYINEDDFKKLRQKPRKERVKKPIKDTQRLQLTIEEPVDEVKSSYVDKIPTKMKAYNVDIFDALKTFDKEIKIAPEIKTQLIKAETPIITNLKKNDVEIKKPQELKNKFVSDPSSPYRISSIILGTYYHKDLDKYTIKELIKVARKFKFSGTFTHKDVLIEKLSKFFYENGKMDEFLKELGHNIPVEEAKKDPENDLETAEGMDDDITKDIKDDNLRIVPPDTRYYILPDINKEMLELFLRFDKHWTDTDDYKIFLKRVFNKLQNNKNREFDINIRVSSAVYMVWRRKVEKYLKNLKKTDKNKKIIELFKSTINKKSAGINKTY